MTALEFTTTQRKVNDLIPLSINPRKISEAKRMKMIESLQKFNLVDLPVIDSDNTVISGHQRLRALQAIGRGEETIDVRIPNRKLTATEIKEYNLLANTHFGEFDFDALDEHFADISFESIGFDMPSFTMPDMSDLGDPTQSGTPNNALYNTPSDTDTPAPPQDYSSKNKEIDIDSLEEDMTFKLKMSKDEYFDLQERLNVVCAKQGVETMTQAVFELLNFYERHEQ